MSGNDISENALKGEVMLKCNYDAGTLLAAGFTTTYQSEKTLLNRLTHICKFCGKPKDKHTITAINYKK